MSKPDASVVRIPLTSMPTGLLRFLTIIRALAEESFSVVVLALHTIRGVEIERPGLYISLDVIEQARIEH
ncbi:MAG TPA: hypothetical protein VMW24_25705 [Sedimentisphaerales bacterium]|nr:hypothetical protein [Sedimentisphaerales bacterium]